ncbi:hypothetical protein DFO56_10843 [Kosakonia sp. AG348]|nr:hypothetical protein DFO56_10843 [Kosakonia sp. AG348]
MIALTGRVTQVFFGRYRCVHGAGIRVTDAGSMSNVRVEG